MNNCVDTPIITLDGPSGTGKGTLCHKLARHLGWNFLDSGAIYRVLAVAAEKNDVSCELEEDLVSLCSSLNIQFIPEENLHVRVLLDDEDVSEEIRTEQTGQNASRIGSIPAVREALLSRQRAFAKAPGLVTDGRDMGTVVFPDAQLKIYLDASSTERAKRRHLQLQGRGISASLVQVADELRLRDERDMARAHAPLKPAKDAFLVDTTGLTIVQVFENILQLVRENL
ncbi:MAG: (d)CMP kinase [Legionellaceae bacterium]|nr:(d)CMP kinase [Legionellaceae bacterium]